MHDEPTMPTGNLGTTAQASPAILPRKSVTLSDEEWLKDRDDKHAERHQYSGAPLTYWPIPEDMQ